MTLWQHDKGHTEKHTEKTSEKDASLLHAYYIMIQDDTSCIEERQSAVACREFFAQWQVPRVEQGVAV